MPPAAGTCSPSIFPICMRHMQALRAFGRQQADAGGASAVSVTESAEGAPRSRSTSPTSSLQRPAAAAATAGLHRPASAAAVAALQQHSQRASPNRHSIFRLAVQGGEHRRADAPQHATHADGGAAAVLHAPADQTAAAGQHGSQGAGHGTQQQRRPAIREAIARMQGSTATLQAAAEAGRLRGELDRARRAAAQRAGGDAADSSGTEPAAPPAAEPVSDAATSDTARSAQPQRLRRTGGSSQGGRPEGHLHCTEGAAEGDSGVSGQALTSRIRHAAMPPPPPLPTSTEVAVIVSSDDDMSFGDFQPALRRRPAGEANEQVCKVCSLLADASLCSHIPLVSQYSCIPCAQEGVSLVACHHFTPACIASAVTDIKGSCAGRHCCHSSAQRPGRYRASASAAAPIACNGRRCCGRAVC